MAARLRRVPSLSVADEAGGWRIYAVATVLSAAAIGLTIAVPLFHGRPYLTSVAALTVAAWLGGHRPAIYSTLLSMVGINLYLTSLGADYGLVAVLQAAAFVGVGLLVAAFARAYRRSEREAQRRNAHLEAMFRQASVGIALLSLDGRLRRVNTRLAAMLGRTVEDAATLSAQDVTHPDDWARDGILIPQVATGQRTEVETDLRLLRADGSSMWVHASIAPLFDPEGRPEAIIGIASDITERRQAEDALRRANSEKDDFLALLAHELRNPLAPIRTAVELLKSRVPADEETRRVHVVMDRQVQHLVRLVDDLLDVSRVLRGKVELRPEPLDVAGVVALAAESSRPLLDTQRQDLVIDLPERPLMIYGDQVRLSQVLSNLLNNASKYSERGGIIRLTVAADGGDAVFRVSDRGAGIPADVLPRVFEPFVQADRSLERSRGGLGIGLTLVKKMVALHGGQVTATSPGLGLGSTFEVRLPLSASAGAAVAGCPEPPARSPLVPRRVLVVDDNVDAAEVLAMLLRLDGHQVDVAHDGQEALRYTQRQAFDVVILDIGLPGMNGYEVAERIRECGHPVPALVAVTGYGQAGDVARALASGFEYHLVKPVEADVLYATIERCSVAREIAGLRSDG